jgi:hypothetical protein
VVRIELPEVPGASLYRVQVAEDAQFQLVRAEATAPKPTLRIQGLADGRYFLRARVADARGLEGLDATHAFTLKARPEPPIPLGPANKAKVRDTGVTMSWSAHPDARQYRLQVATDAGFAHPVVDRSDVRDTQLAVSLPPGDYFWRLGTTASGPDAGPWGDALTVLMREPPAQLPPPQVTADALSFALQAEPGQRFEFQIAPEASFSTISKEVASSSSTVLIPRPAEGGRLYVRYRAIDADGFIGPYTRPQLVALPSCLRDGSGQCIVPGTDKRFVTTRP